MNKKQASKYQKTVKCKTSFTIKLNKAIDNENNVIPVCL